MLWISIKKQRQRQPFFKFCLAKEMPAIFEVMFGGRTCGCYILTISIEKPRKCPPFLFFQSICGVRIGELREARIPMRPATGVLLRPTGYIFTALAWLYMALLKQLLTQFVFFTCLPKHAFCEHKISTLAQSDDKQPSRRQGGAWKGLVKMHMKWKLLWMLKNTYANVIRMQ